MPTSPTQRTLAKCKSLGWRAQVVEKWLAHVGRRVDLFGFGDVIALDGKVGSLLIQATTTSNGAARVAKITEDCCEAARDWLHAGNRLEVWGWAKRGKVGKRKLWTLRRWRIACSRYDEDVQLVGMVVEDEDERDSNAC